MRKSAVVLLMASLFFILVPLTAWAAVQNATLSVYPLAPGTASQYNIGFYTTSSGALKGGQDRIIIEFPEGTVIPSSIGSGKILINGESVSSSSIYVSDNILTLRLPGNMDIAAKGYAGVVITQSAGIKTPLKGGTYYLIISTTNDSAAKTNSYSVEGTKVSRLEVAVTPATADEYAEYEIAFRTSSKGALTGGNDYIYIEFPLDAELPKSISTSHIKVNGEKPGGVNVDRDTNTVAVKLASKQNIKSSTDVNVTVSESAGIRNPDDPGKYELGVYTSQDSLLIDAVYSVGLSISPPLVAVSPAEGGVNGQYSIGFTTSSKGTLAAGEGYIYLYFPSGTTVPSTISSSYVTVNGYKARSVSCTRSERKVAVRIPSDINIQKNSYVQVVIKSSAGIKNPGKGGKYRLEVATSADTGKVKSKEYTITGIATSLSRPEVELSTYKAGQYPDITIEFELGSGGDLEGGYDEITIVFPDEFSLPGSLSRSDITINGDRIDDYEINDNELVLTIPADLEGGDDVEIVIDSLAKVRNPITSGNYRLEIYTSRDSSRIQSSSFNIGSESDRILPQVELSNYLPGQTSQWLIAIFASKDWDTEESDNIIITFPAGTAVPYSIANYFVEVNDIVAKYALVNDRELTIGLPDDVVVEDGEKVVVRILEAAGIQNPTEPGNYSIEVITPENDDSYESKEYRISSGGDITTGNKIIFRIGSKLASRGNQLVQLDAAPTIINDFTVVPLRALGDALGAVTEYDSLTQVITVKYNNKELIFIVNSRMVKVDGEWMSIDVAPTIIEGRTMIPARFVSQSFGATVEWKADTQEVIISN